MKSNKPLTNEMLNKRFDNPFSLVNYAISIAKGLVVRGEERETNVANDVMEMIEEGRDKIEQPKEEVEEEIEVES
ncbi:MAG: hypothetical protein K1000chlam4_00033 [Chlamydiae bacterium]|nr:hypothetical protein [Chlamydiota bacterium]